MAWLDISTPIRDGMAVYPGDPPVVVTRALAMARGDMADVTALSMGAHVGTHVDAPAHALPGGPGVEAVPIDAMIGDAIVVDVPADAVVDAGLLRRAALAPHCRRVLLRTGASGGDPASEGAPLSIDGARYLLQRGIVLVGTDTMSVAPADDPMPVHRLLLGAGVVIVEGLRLAAARSGPCRLICLPLLVAGADGAPARAVIEQADPPV
ncbi:MAG: cyclase family protein [Thermoleophilia bacterium]|jgi:arylformamidase